MSDLAKIEEIYHAVLEKPPGERAEFLAEMCGAEDEDLRREVEDLLKFEEEAEDFIETPPAGLAAELISGAGNTLIGKTLKHYRVLSLLGAGGMGEVYLAEDMKLGRRAALKIFPSQFSASPDRKKRFEREARAASALSHPNIITIYGIETAKNLDFIAAEHVEGETLRERIGRERLTVRETLEIAVQIADALEAAHSVGVVHRDIKPANIMIRPDGLVKILDFGLAKLTSADSAEMDREVAARELFTTKSGVIMGTVNYMSPEQALGDPLDARTDVWSFGAVLYEMLSGVTPFAGASDAAVYNGIINKTPPSLKTSNSEIPAGLDEIVSRALAKNSDDRYQSAKDLRLDLQKLKLKTGTAATTAASAVAAGTADHLTVERNNLTGQFQAATDSSNERFNAFPVNPGSGFSVKKLLLPLAAVVILPAFFLFGYYKYTNGEAVWAVTPRNFGFTQFTSSGNVSLPSLSPDGKTIIFTGGENGNRDIFFQRVGGANAINLTKDSPFSDDYQAAYAPDGERIAFRSDRGDGGGLFVMGATGENVRKVADSGFYPAWSPDGSEIAFCRSTFDDPTVVNLNSGAIEVLNLASGERRVIYDKDGFQPSWSPDGGRIAFWSVDAGGNRDIKTVSPYGGKGGEEEAVPVTDDPAFDWNPVWSPDGKYLYFSSSRGGSMNFWRVAIDQKTGKTLGAAEPFTTPSLYGGNLTFARNGKLLAYVQATNASNIVEAEFNPKTETLAAASVKEITRGGRIDRNPSVSPDGERIAFDAIKDKQEDVFLMRRDGSNVVQLTNDASKDRAPRWSPDGKKLIFYSNRSGSYEAWTINADGSDLSQVTFDSEPPRQLSFWSPDGKKILQNQSGEEALIFDAFKPAAEQKPAPLAAFDSAGLWLMAFSWSPDADKLGLMVLGKEKDYFGIYTYSFSSQQYQKITDYGDSPVWLNDSRRLIFFDKNKVFLHDTRTSKTKELMTLTPNEALQGITISPDNRFIYFSLEKKESNIWLATPAAE